MKKRFLYLLLVTYFSITSLGCLGEDPELPDIKNLTIEEAMVLLGPAYGYNVSWTGLITFENNSTWQIIKCPNTGMTEMRKMI